MSQTVQVVLSAAGGVLAGLVPAAWSIVVLRERLITARAQLERVRAYGDKVMSYEEISKP